MPFKDVLVWLFARKTKAGSRYLYGPNNELRGLIAVAAAGLAKVLFMQPGEIHTIYDFIRYCREVLAERPEYMREKEQQRPASAIVAACVVDSFNALEKEYPKLTAIFDLASNLEWSNSFSTSEDWRAIKLLIDELEQQVMADDHGPK